MVSEAAARPFAAIPVVTVPPEARKNPVAYLMGAAIAGAPILRRATPPKLVGRYGPWQVFLVGPAANRFVTHTHRDAFAHEPGWRAFFGGVWNENLLYLDGARHAAHRRIMTPAFTSAGLERALPALQRLIAARLATWGERATVEIRAELRDLAFDAVAEGLLGFPAAAAPGLHALRDALCRNPHSFGSPAYRDHIHTRRADLNAALGDLLARHDAAGADLAALLLAARADPLSGIDDEFLLGHTQVMLEAGHTTTMDLATWTLGLLATHPAEQARLRAEADALPAPPWTLNHLKALPALSRAIDEAGRLRAPVDTAPRGVTRDVVFAGYTIPAGTFTRLHLGAGHRLPEVFAAPERFDPDRFAPPRLEHQRTPFALAAFGGGPRICVGYRFAMVEITALVALTLRTYRVEPDTATPPNVFDPGLLDDSLPRGLPLRFVAR